MSLLRFRKFRRMDVTGKALKFFALLSLLMLINARVPPQAAVAREFQIKAVFLYNFTRFVQWPETAFGRSDAPFVIGILGDNPFGSYLDQTVTGESAGDHGLVIERYSSPDEIRECHILFVDVDSKQEVTRALEQVKGKPVLTVSDGEGFARLGGMIHFYNEDARIRLRINANSVDESGLKVSSKLMRLAEIIPSKND